MARDLMDENYYISGGGMIPIKWTAPEVSCVWKTLYISVLVTHIQTTEIPICY